MISIVVPCYNCETTLMRCVDSIRNQTERQIEIVLVDDGSKDKTLEICEMYAQKDNRVHVVHQNNKGLMSAWKRGVAEASGEYVIFCDSDDYLDLDIIEILQNKVNSIHVDIIAYGMKMEYEKGGVIYQNNRLAEGYYTRGEIIKDILPCYFSDGSMESVIMLASRGSKLFRRDLLIKNYRYLDEKISVGEDALTTFAAVLAANTIYCMNNFYPYHYLRNDDSMIGKYDSLLFQKFIALRAQMYQIANAYQYAYDAMIEGYFISKVFLCMKKEICRNKSAGYRRIRENLIAMRKNPIMISALAQCSIKRYDLPSKIFAKLIIGEHYFIVCYLTWLADKVGMGQA